MKQKKVPSLQTQLYAAYLGIILLILTAFGIFFYSFVSRELISEEVDTLYNDNLSLKDSVENSVQDMDTVSININYSSIVKNKLSNDFNLRQNKDTYKNLSDLFVMINGTDSRVDYIYLYDMNNNRLQVDAVQKLTHVDSDDEPWFKKAVEYDGAPYISVPYSKKVGNYTSDCVSLYRTYVNSSHQTVGIVETAKQCKSIFKSIIRYEKKNTSPAHIFIYNEEGSLIYPYKKGAADPSYPHIGAYRKFLSSNGANIQKVENPLNQKKEYLTSLHSGYTGWTYYAVQDESAILAPLNSLIRTLLIFIAVLTLFSVIVSHYLSRRLVRPLEHLKQIIQKMRLSTLGAEKLDSHPVFTSEIKELYDSFSEMDLNLRKSRDELISLQEAELEARSLALQSQMSPHFYYNSLSSIMILAENGDTKSVADMCQNLSGIMRYVTDFKTRIVSIEKELNYIEEYLYCMKVRNQSSLNYEINVPKELTEIQIPKLCIHPIVENALKYGTNCEPPWSVKITGEVKKSCWKIHITDDGPGFSQDSLVKLKNAVRTAQNSPSMLGELQINGLGLVNIYTRLAIYFNNHFIFEYGNSSSGHAVVTIGAYFPDPEEEEAL